RRRCGSKRRRHAARELRRCGAVATQRDGPGDWADLRVPLGSYTELMEHSSHGCSERVVVRVERCRVVGAATWSEFLGGSEQWFNGLVSEHNQGGYRLEACWPGLIATCRADAMHDLLAAEL